MKFLDFHLSPSYLHQRIQLDQRMIATPDKHGWECVSNLFRYFHPERFFVNILKISSSSQNSIKLTALLVPENNARFKKFEFIFHCY